MKIDFTEKVHPVAELFPMLSDEELDDLAADIKENGQIHPIVLDSEGTLIDGRNRLEACKRAGVHPRFTVLDGQDPIAFIISTNVTRRHLTKGQQAMAVAKARLLSKQTVRKAAETIGTSPARVTQASIVLDHAPDLADLVLAGTMPLNEAYQAAKKQKEVAQSEEGKMADLREKAPDLADQVTEEHLTLDEALGALQARWLAERKQKEVEEQQRQLATRHIEEVIDSYYSPNTTPKEAAERLVSLYDRKFSRSELDRDKILYCSQMLKSFATEWHSRHGQKTSNPQT